ncbi:MAG: Gfo/Idh/MocA family oxidoreductase, partial [Tannerellaceae bacterium]|nr:Gfo/Idh/MocA family oxidoreductase [Tannerellaceae bacterium]
MSNPYKFNRRDFFKSSAMGAIGAISVPGLLSSCSGTSSQPAGEAALKDVIVPEILKKAPDGKPLKAGLVGCGGRGSGAAINFLDAGSGLEVTALGDIFQDKLDSCRAMLKEKGQTVADTNCFIGFDAYRQVIDSGVDVVLLCTPPVFRPAHFDYAIEKGKHCFIEKPCAVDPTGAKQMLITAKRADQKGLSIISGTIR